MSTYVPSRIRLLQGQRILEISYESGETFQLSCEFLRVHSPSAEVQGHGPGQGVLQTGKENVNITAVEPIGNYAVRLVFDDGHDSGLFSWDYLHRLGRNRDAYWAEYQAALAAAADNAADS